MLLRPAAACWGRMPQERLGDHALRLFEGCKGQHPADAAGREAVQVWKDVKTD